MFHSFDEELFNKAIKEKDLVRLKTNTVSAIRNDPTFSGKKSGEIGNVLRILHEKIPDIFEEERDLGYEEHLEESQWDSRYFTRLTFWFQENFAEKRLDEIEAVGKKVFSAELNKEVSKNIQMQKANSSEIVNPVSRSNHSQPKGAVRHPTQAPRPQKKKRLLSHLWIPVAVIAGILALVLIIIKLFR